MYLYFVTLHKNLLNQQVKQASISTGIVRAKEFNSQQTNQAIYTIYSIYTIPHIHSV